ncbi:Proteasome subunit alpha type-3; Flags: Fragment [Serendipita indica DSM 11827]|nr:Proteasome subunit alpha type-3; Flags: Fragment [Serendipita indica DSM 11827]
MTSIGTGYDLSASTYSPDGRIFQVEYANKAVENAGTAIGLRVKDGVVLAVEKIIHSKLLMPESNKRILTIDRHIGYTSSGLLADGRQLANRAREEAQSSRDFYREPPTLKAIVNRLIRPFGCTSLLAAVDKHGPGLYVIEPSGISLGYHGAAVGKGRQLAKTELEKLKLSELSMREAVFEAARIIHLVHDDAKEKDFELEMSWIGSETNNVHLPVPKDLFLEADRKAREALEEDMED